LKLTCTKIGLSVEVKQELLDELYRTGMKHYPKEFGGLLIGYYSEDFKTCFIETTILPKKYKSSRYFFEREKEGLKLNLTNFYNSIPRLIYVGEWHTHPDGIPSPSGTDMNAMIEIGESDDVNIENPLLLVLGINPSKMDVGAYVYSKNKLLRYE